MLVCSFCGNDIYERGDGKTPIQFTFVNTRTKRWAHEDCLDDYNLYVRCGYSDFRAKFMIKHTARIPKGV